MSQEPVSRPRVEGEREREILAAALEVLAEVGYDRLTMDAVAAAAKALAKQTGGDKIAGLARARISRVGGDHAGYLAWFDDVVPPGNFGPAGSEQADDPPGDKIVVYDADFTVRDVYYF